MYVVVAKEENFIFWGFIFVLFHLNFIFSIKVNNKKISCHNYYSKLFYIHIFFYYFYYLNFYYTQVQVQNYYCNTALGCHISL